MDIEINEFRIMRVDPIVISQICFHETVITIEFVIAWNFVFFYFYVTIKSFL